MKLKNIHIVKPEFESFYKESIQNERKMHHLITKLCITKYNLMHEPERKHLRNLHVLYHKTQNTIKIPSAKKIIYDDLAFNKGFKIAMGETNLFGIPTSEDLEMCKLINGDWEDIKPIDYY